MQPNSNNLNKNSVRIVESSEVFAFIDSQNLNFGILELGWKLDFKKFRVFLKDKYKVSKAYIFIGYKKGNESLYTYLQNSGYVCIFKPSLEFGNGRVKGNVDAELVLHTMINFYNFDKALIVSGDGDFYCLVEYLVQQNKLLKLLVPNKRKYSSLYKKISRKDFKIFDFVSDQKLKLEEIKKDYSKNEKGSQRD